MDSGLVFLVVTGGILVVVLPASIIAAWKFQEYALDRALEGWRAREDWVHFPASVPEIRDAGDIDTEGRRPREVAEALGEAEVPIDEAIEVLGGAVDRWADGEGGSGDDDQLRAIWATLGFLHVGSVERSSWLDWGRLRHYRDASCCFGIAERIREDEDWQKLDYDSALDRLQAETDTDGTSRTWISTAVGADADVGVDTDVGADL